MAATLPYKLPKKAIKRDCPQCGPKHRKTFSLYVETATGETLPEIFGRCDREGNCGYHNSPYHKGTSGTSYHDEQKEKSGGGPIPKEWFRMAGKQKRNAVTRQGFMQTLMAMEGATPQQAERVATYIYDRQPEQDHTPPPVYTIPNEVFRPSLGHYDRNQLARLLRQYFGYAITDDLLRRFQIGTSSRWPGACVFWYIDEQSRIRGGQIKLFDDNWHTVKYTNQEGKKCSKTSWVHSALIRRHTEQNTPVPEWLSLYDEHAERSPCLFGLPQLLNAPIDQPVAVVEAPKTAILCTPYFPDYTWLAAGALSYLTPERLVPLRNRNVTLYPDASVDGVAFGKWSQRAEELNAKGFKIKVSDFMEKGTTDEQKQQGYDLADFVLSEWPGYPPDWDIEPGSLPTTQLITSPTGPVWSEILPAEKVMRMVPIHMVG
jgi:hypothetical protein